VGFLGSTTFASSPVRYSCTMAWISSACSCSSAVSGSCLRVFASASDFARRRSVFPPPRRVHAKAATPSRTTPRVMRKSAIGLHLFGLLDEFRVDALVEVLDEGGDGVRERGVPRHGRPVEAVLIDAAALVEHVGRFDERVVQARHDGEQILGDGTGALAVR